jgi:hypothetical protein
VPKLNENKSQMFQILTLRLEESELSEIKMYLLSFEEHSRYFPGMSKKFFYLVKSLFTFDVADTSEIAHEKFVELTNSTAIKS